MTLVKFRGLWLLLIGLLLSESCSPPSQPIALVDLVQDGSRPYGVVFLDNEQLAVVERCISSCPSQVIIFSLDHPQIPRLTLFRMLWANTFNKSEPVVNVDMHPYIIPALLGRSTIVFPRPSGEWPNLGIMKILEGGKHETSLLSFKDPRRNANESFALFATYVASQASRIILDFGGSDCVFIARADRLGPESDLIPDHTYCADKSVDRAVYRSKYIASIGANHGVFMHEPKEIGRSTYISAGDLDEGNSANVLKVGGKVKDVIVIRDHIITLHDSPYFVESLTSPALLKNGQDDSRQQWHQSSGISIYHINTKQIELHETNRLESSMTRPLLIFCLLRQDTKKIDIKPALQIINSKLLDTWSNSGYVYLGSSPDASKVAFRRSNQIYVYDLSSLEC